MIIENTSIVFNLRHSNPIKNVMILRHSNV